MSILSDFSEKKNIILLLGIIIIPIFLGYEVSPVWATNDIKGGIVHYFPQRGRSEYTKCPICPLYPRHPIIDLYLYYKEDTSITQIKEQILPELSQKFNIYITLFLRPLESPDHEKEFSKLIEKQDSLTLPVFVYKESIIPVNELSQKLKAMFPESHFTSRRNFFMILPIIAGGVIDGINPCAFAVLVFFLSYLSLLSKKRIDVLLSGIGFLVGTYIVYLLIGLGILTGIHLIFASHFSNLFHYLIVTIALILGILSLYDFVLIKQGKGKKILLQLPETVKKKIHTSIRDRVKTHALYVAGFVVAIPICLSEFVCTGQVYIPLTTYISRISYTNIQMVGYLALYNLMFITPLLGVFLLVYTGTSWKVFLNFLQHNLAKLKLSMCLLFFVLAGLLWFKF